MAFIMILQRAILAVAILALSIPATVSIDCYKCSFVSQRISINETVKVCSDFDYSSDFVVDCKYSTMCMKKTFELHLLNGEVVRGIERDCASQKNELHVLEGGKWNLRANIEESYQEGCVTVDDKGARLSPPQYCYCRGHLCNSAPSRDRNELSYHVDAMAVIFVFNAIKYYRSME